MQRSATRDKDETRRQSGAPQPKELKRRIGAACMTCRKRKTACSGERPYCNTCKQNNLYCAGFSTDSQSQRPKHGKVETGSPTSSDKEDAPKNNTFKKPHSSPPKSSTPRDGNRRSSLVATQDQSAHPDAGNQSSSANGEGDGDGSGNPNQQSLFSGPRNRMPYFRWLGPTAVVPGFKQMVVKVKHQGGEFGGSSISGDLRSPSLKNAPSADQSIPSIYSGVFSRADSDTRTPTNLPFYDTSSTPPSELITHLAITFFNHLGCTYRFLQKDRFLRDLEQKQVDAILVDAVCALAARFSNHPLLTQSYNDPKNKPSPAEYGHSFAQRAKTALTETFAMPTVAAAQAALLLAYNEFGEQKDSGLWMYLGIAIRLAQDLGMHTVEGLKYVGRVGPTPKSIMVEPRRGGSSSTTAFSPEMDGVRDEPTDGVESPEEQNDINERKAVEQERVDTFWAIFFLDRVVSSGTGRRSTLPDKDIELSFPPFNDNEDEAIWPAPYPPLIRIVHLQGRVADLLNSIKKPDDITIDTPKRLAAMEDQVTNFYQSLPDRLHFNAINFQHYMQVGEGTGFVLLHFWFHTLIVLLHQPTLLKTFEGRMLQLFPNSQQLSMSSAKTIADILSYSQLMDAKAPLGNPFTTQPIYIAACAFLKEIAEQTAGSNAQSRATSPIPDHSSNLGNAPRSGSSFQNKGKTPADLVQPTSSPREMRTSQSSAGIKTRVSKHTLLATAATQHYQLCYKALQSIETYWAGTKYILTVLDQKSEGVGDPLLYTVEEGESSLEQPKPEPTFTSPGWRRKLYSSPGTVNADMENLQSSFWRPVRLEQLPDSPSGVDPSKAIGWTLTGTMNSPSTNLAWHYTSGDIHNQAMNASTQEDGPFESEDAMGRSQSMHHTQSIATNSTNSRNFGDHGKDERSPVQDFDARPAGIAHAETGTFDGSNLPFNGLAHASSSRNDSVEMFGPGFQTDGNAAPTGGLHPQGTGELNFPYHTSNMYFMSPAGEMQPNFPAGDMMIESQEVDASMLGLDMMSWFDSYPTHEVMAFFDHGEDNSTRPPESPNKKRRTPTTMPGF